MMNNSAPTTTDPVAAALANLTASGIAYTEVDHCADATCAECHATTLATAA
jgi:hypothetical protein